MRQRKIRWKVIPKIPDSVGEILVAPRRKVPALSVKSDEKSESLRRQNSKQTVMPKRRAFRPRRKISPFRRSRIAKPHWHERDALRVVEFLRTKACPVAKPDATVVFPRNAARMDAGSWRLADDDQAGLFSELNDRADSVRQMLGADLAPAYFRTQ